MTRHATRRLISAMFIVTMVAGVLIGSTGPASAAISVNCNAGDNLQNKLTSAPAGSTVLVKGTCHGNFTISGKTLTLKGNPSATLDGMDAGPTLIANSPGDVVHLIGLTVTGGFYSFGAGLLSADALTLKNVKVTGNLTTSTTTAAGGGILTFGNLTVDSSTISSNRAAAAGNGSLSIGAGIYVGGNAKISNSVLSGNVGTAFSGSGAAEVDGSAIATGGKLTISNTKITNNSTATSGDGGTALGTVYVESSAGAPVSLTKTTVSGNSTAAVSSTATSGTAVGAILVQDADLTISSSKITANSVTGSSTGAGMTAIASGAYGTQKMTVKGSSVLNNVGTASGTTSLFEASMLADEMHIATSSISGNTGTAVSSAGGATAVGHVIANSLTMSRSTVNGNVLSVDATGGGATAVASVDASALTMDSSTVSRNTVASRTRTNANTAVAVAGGVYGSGSAKNSTIALNRVSTIAAGASGAVVGVGGGFYDNGATDLTDLTIAGNKVSGTGATETLEAGGLAGSASTQLKGTIIAGNTAAIGPDCFSNPTSNGHNLIGKTAGCAFSKKSTDKVNKSAKLGTLKSNGGPTQTMAIAGTSPARNAGVCPPNVDQRGVHRPQGSKCDIGAFELKASEASSSIAMFKLPTYVTGSSVGSSRAVTAATIRRALDAIPSPTAFLDGIRGLRAVRFRLP